MECRISSLLHLYLMISGKYILLIKNILVAKTWSKCMFELPNIDFNSMFTFLAVHDKMWRKKWKLLPDFCPIQLSKGQLVFVGFIASIQKISSQLMFFNPIDKYEDGYHLMEFCFSYKITTWPP